MTNAVLEDDLTILSRNALAKVAKVEFNLDKPSLTNFTVDELRDHLRSLRLAKNPVAPILSMGDEGGDGWKIVLNVLPVHQLGRDAFLTTIKYTDIDKIEVDAEVQRPETKRRIGEISNYFASADGYLGTVVLTVIGQAVLDENRLILDQSCRIVVNDGQHRIAGIRKAIAEGMDADRLNDDLPVLIYSNLSKYEQRQLFADINLHAAKPAKAVALNFNNRDMLVRFAKDVVARSTAFAGRVNFLKAKIGAKDTEVFTFSAIVDAVGSMFDDLSPITYHAHLADAVDFWAKVNVALGSRWSLKQTIAHTKVSLSAIARLYGFNNIENLDSLDWSVGGELDQIVSSAGGTNAAIKALSEALAAKVVE